MKVTSPQLFNSNHLCGLVRAGMLSLLQDTLGASARGGAALCNNCGGGPWRSPSCLAYDIWHIAYL